MDGSGGSSVADAGLATDGASTDAARADTGGTDGASDGGAGTDAPTLPARVLLYSFSTLNIASVPAQISILKAKLQGWNFTVDESKDPAVFTDTNLAKYAAVGMINTCFYPFGSGATGLPESQALQRFMKKGGGLFGTHCAAVTYQSSNPPALYNQLIGGRGNNGSFDGTSSCRKMADHPSITGLPSTFNYVGNLDNTDFLAADTVVLVKCKWSGGAGTDVAVSWTRTEELGRVFYSNFGKVDADLTNTTIGDPHLIAGLSWVLRR